MKLFELRNLNLLLIAIYVISFAFETIFTTIFKGNNVLLPELVFVIIAPILLINCLSVERIKEFSGLKFVQLTIIYISIVFISYLYTFKPCALGEFLASCYALSILFVVYLVVRVSCNEEKICDFIIYSGVFAACFSITGYLAGTIFNFSFFNSFYSDYPLTGDTFRGRGMIRGPMIAADLISIALLLQLKQNETRINFNRRNIFFVVILIAGGISTLTKSFIIVAGLILVFFSSEFNISKKLTKALGIILILLYFIMSHFLIIKNNDIFIKKFASSPYSSNIYYPINNDFILVPTIYSTQKYVSMLAGINNFPLGIGANCHMAYAKDMYNQGRINANVSLTAHSTYFGAFGELGIFGLLVICCLYFIGLKIAINQLNKSMILCVLFIILSGMTIDNMNLRHHWVLFGILLGSGFLQIQNHVKQ